LRGRCINISIKIWKYQTDYIIFASLNKTTMKKEMENEVLASCTNNAKKVLEGRTIKSVRYMTDEECQHMMWSKKSVVLTLDNGTLAFLSADDEGNDGGSMYYVKDGQMNVICTI
jgi:hypothetical protein